MTIAALCLFAMVTLAQKTIRVAAGKTDLVMQVSPKGRLYQVYLGEKLQNATDYDQLKWDVYAASDGASVGMRCVPLRVPRTSLSRLWLSRMLTET